MVEGKQYRIPRRPYPASSDEDSFGTPTSRSTSSFFGITLSPYDVSSPPCPRGVGSRGPRLRSREGWYTTGTFKLFPSVGTTYLSIMSMTCWSDLRGRDGSSSGKYRPSSPSRPVTLGPLPFPVSLRNTLSDKRLVVLTYGFKSSIVETCVRDHREGNSSPPTGPSRREPRDGTQ